MIVNSETLFYFMQQNHLTSTNFNKTDITELIIKFIPKYNSFGLNTVQTKM